MILTSSDVATIHFVGGRYEWSSSLISLLVFEGRNMLDAMECLALCSAIERDMEGGHNAFPMLDPNSELCEKLYALYKAFTF